MYKVVFTMRESGALAAEEERHEFYFQFETDANNFYDDLENFIKEKFGEKYYVVFKSKPEKSSPIDVHGYDVKTKSLYKIY